MIDITKLPFDLTAIKSIKEPEKLFQVFPVLNDYPEFKLTIPIPLPRAFELIVLLYSQRGLLVQRHSTAKVEAAQYFGYKTIGDKINDKDISELLSGQNSEFNKMIIAYARMQHNAKFSQFIIWVVKYYKCLDEFVTGDSDEKNKDLYKLIKDLQEDISVLEKELLKNDISPELHEELYAEVERISLGIRPEEIAQKLADGEDPLPGFNPYGKDYKFSITADRSKVNPHEN